MADHTAFITERLAEIQAEQEALIAERQAAEQTVRRAHAQLTELNAAKVSLQQALANLAAAGLAPKAD